MFITTSSPLHKSIIPSPMLRCLLTTLFALSVLATIVLFLLQQTKNTLQDISSTMANDVLSQIEEMATNTHTTLDHLSEYSDRSCSEVKEQLENLLITGIYLHSIHLFKNNIIYCSSVYRAIGFPVAGKEHYANGEMLLFTSDKVNKNIPLLVHRRDNEHAGILSLIDGRYLRLALNVQEDKGFIALHVGSTWMTETDQTADGPLPKLTFVTKLKSQQFPITIVAGFHDQILWQRLWENNGVLLTILILLLLLLSVVIARALKQPYSIQRTLKKAHLNQEFIPYLQSIVNSQGKLCGAEALMRWQITPEQLVSPIEFIPAMEETGLIVPITSSIIRQLADTLEPQQLRLPNNFYISFNISKAHFKNLSLLEDCRYFIDKLSIKKVKICLEITERELIEQTDLSDYLLEKLAEMEVKIAIDDFGTGHASFDYLQRFRVDILKIGRGFITNIGANSFSEHLIETMIELSQKLNLLTIAEGVETIEQSQYLEKHGVTFQQGFLFAKPISMQAFIQINGKHKESEYLP